MSERDRKPAIESVRDAIAAVARQKSERIDAWEEATGHLLCRRCECCDLDWQECHECGGDGYYEDDSDPLWGVEQVLCSTCEGHGGWDMCLGRCDDQGRHESARAKAGP